MSAFAAQLQLDFPPRDADALCRDLAERFGQPLRLTLTDNSSTIMSVRRHRTQGVDLRLHHMFLHAEPSTIEALAVWLKRPKDAVACATLDSFIRENRHRMKTRDARPVRVSTRGLCFDLQALFDEVNREYFENSISARITWGKRPANGRRRSIRFGSYSVREHLIRIHPYLDCEFVPEWFVRYIVFHEMLHAHLGIEESETGRRKIHTREFNCVERTYPDFERAERWLKQPANLRKLLR